MRKKRNHSNGVPVEYRALTEAYHDACYVELLKRIEKFLTENPEAQARLKQLIAEFRNAVFSNLQSSFKSTKPNHHKRVQQPAKKI